MLKTNLYQVIDLLQRASMAHGKYETEQLNGVYDQQWAPWYAGWLIDHGINQALGTDFETDGFGQLLYDLNESHKRERTGENWAQYTARRLLDP